MENSRDRQFITCTLWAGLSRVMQYQASCFILPWVWIIPVWRFLLLVHGLFGYQINCGVAQSCANTPIFYLIAPKYKRSDAGNSEMPRRSRQVLPLSEKMKVLDVIRKEKTSYAEAAKICGKNRSFYEMLWIGEEGKNCTSSAVVSQTGKVMAIVYDKCSVKMEKVLNL